MAACSGVFSVGTRSRHRQQVPTRSHHREQTYNRLRTTHNRLRTNFKQPYNKSSHVVRPSTSELSSVCASSAPAGCRGSVSLGVRSSRNAFRGMLITIFGIPGPATYATSPSRNLQQILQQIFKPPRTKCIRGLCVVLTLSAVGHSA